MLLVLYVFLDYIAMFFELYITVAGGIACSIVIQEIMLGLRPLSQMFEDQRGRLKSFILPYFNDEMTFLYITALAFGLSISISWYFTYNWMLNNMVALSLAFTFLKSVRLNRLIPGVILLSSLFFYDIFWVFYSTKFTKGG